MFDEAGPALGWSVSICPQLLQAAALREFDEIQVWNLTSGARFTTYAMEGEPGRVKPNGTATYLARAGDILEISARRGDSKPRPAIIVESGGGGLRTTD